MHLGKVCGRPIQSPWVSDSPPVCLMHSHQPGKSDEEFQKAIEEIFQAAQANLASGDERSYADFTKFVFPSATYGNRTIYVRCVFNEATFTEDTRFNNVAFCGSVSFISTTFAKAADFRETTFDRESAFDRATFNGPANFTSVNLDHNGSFMQTAFEQADFEGAKFVEDANFSSATFAREASFIRARFRRYVSFLAVKFNGATNFFGAEFTQEADFRAATFTQDTNFIQSIFTLGAAFHDATFTEHAFFNDTKFAGATDFSVAKFKDSADFRDAEFTTEASFRNTTFACEANFRRAKFLESVEFRETEFRGAKFTDPELRKAALNDDKTQPGPIFSLAQFFQPEKVIFYRTYLGRALFYNCDVSEVRFSSVTWRKRGRKGKCMLFEEGVDLNHDAARDLKPHPGSLNERNYLLIAETYRQLKKNYDDRTEYMLAGHFHYGEMEMRRLSSFRQSKVIRWLHQKLLVVALYKYASQYGESYVRPLLVLAGVLLFFTLLFPWAGLDMAGTNSQLTYPHFSDFVNAHPHPTGVCRVGLFLGYALRATFGHSLMTAISVAGFQKELKYAPSYPWGRALALFELLLTSTLIALFLLALRRQFKR